MKQDKKLTYGKAVYRVMAEAARRNLIQPRATMLGQKLMVNLAMKMGFAKEPKEPRKNFMVRIAADLPPYQGKFDRPVKKPKPKKQPLPSLISAEKAQEFYASFEWRALRYHVLKELGARCLLCGATPQTGAIIHVDHIKPLRKHWDLRLARNNLQVLCHECNHGKGNHDETDWR
jgi:5-methylcytosine-specific restriction endonuclease McrA